MMDMCDIALYQARTLLIAYRWDWPKLNLALCDRGKEEVFREAGVTSLKTGGEESNHAERNGGAVGSQESEMRRCGSCFEDATPGSYTTMECGHTFCNECK